MPYVTTGDIAKETDTDRDQVSYALRKSGVEPIGRAGIVRLFPTSAVATVREFLESRRKARHDARWKREGRRQATDGPKH
jgi:hypothetical protein